MLSSGIGNLAHLAAGILIAAGIQFIVGQMLPDTAIILSLSLQESTWDLRVIKSRIQNQRFVSQRNLLGSVQVLIILMAISCLSLLSLVQILLLAYVISFISELTILLLVTDLRVVG